MVNMQSSKFLKEFLGSVHMNGPASVGQTGFVVLYTSRFQIKKKTLSAFIQLFLH